LSSVFILPTSSISTLSSSKYTLDILLFPFLKLDLYIKPYIDSDVYGMLVVKWWNQNKNTWHVGVEVYYLFILFIFQKSIGESGFVDQSTNERHFIFIFIIIWTCMNLSLVELYLKFMTVIYFVLFYLNLWLNICFLNNFVNTRITNTRRIWIRNIYLSCR